MIRTWAALAVIATLGACLATEPGQVSRLGSNSDLLQMAAPEGYQRLFSPAPHNFRAGISAAGDPVRFGTSSERFELRDGDCGGSDCSNPRARAEIQVRHDNNKAKVGEDIWYGWSFYNATVPSFTKQNALRLVFGQWSVGDGQKPIIRFIQLGKGEGDFAKCDPRVCVGPNKTSGDLVVQLEDIANAKGWGDAQNDGYICRLFDLSNNRGKWVDLKVNTNFSSGPDGYLRIWVNGRLACNYSGPLVSAASVATGKPPKHRRGIFSSWDKRWRKATGDARKPALIVYYDEFRTGTSHAQVDVSSLAARPVD